MEHLPDASLPSSIARLPAYGAAEPLRAASRLLSEIYLYQVPDFAAAALDRLHGSLYASVRQLELCGLRRCQMHTWVGSEVGEVVGVLLFRVQGRRIMVLTEMMGLSAAQADAFAAAVLTRFPTASCIVFNAVALSFTQSAFPSQQYIFSENYILDLPDSTEHYLARLGKATRKTIKGYGNRLTKDFPDFAWRSCEASTLGAAERQALVQQLQAYKRASMAARAKEAVSDEHETQRILTLAGECGLFGIATINGRVCAGALSCRIGAHYVMLLSAADPELERYRLGLLVCYWSVCDCISRHARQCHLLWGRYPYKSQLLAVPHALCHLVLYRSRWHMMTMPAAVLGVAARGLIFRGRLWLLEEISKRDTLGARLLRGVMQLRRRIRLPSQRDGAPTP